MNFKEKSKPSTTVKAIANLAPQIGINANALAKMSVYVDKCPDEIGWLGTVESIGKRRYIISDVFLFDQNVHSTTTEITPEGLSTFGEEILTRPDGMEIWNNLKMWGHSHVNMGVFASGQDDKQMEEFESIGQPWFVRLICNKKGDMTIDFFDYEHGISYLDVPWIELSSPEESEIKNKIAELEEQLRTQATARMETYTTEIEEEMKEKVKKFSTATTQNSSYSNAYGHMVNNKWVAWTQKEKEEYLEEEKKTERGKSTITGQRIGFHTITEPDEFEEDDDVTGYFTQDMLCELAECITLNELEAELSLYGYHNYFTDNDLETILRVAYKTQARVEGIYKGGNLL